jgi:transposase
MVTASGKTFVAVHTARELQAERVLVLVPSLDLLTQTAQAWRTVPDLVQNVGRALRMQPGEGNAQRLDRWIATDLPHLHTFTRGLDQDRDAVNTALPHPFHNGCTEGVNMKTKLIKRQMYGRAGSELLRHHILLG